MKTGKNSALALLNTLVSYKDLVVQLPASDKSGCSIKRFYLYLLPLFQLALKQDQNKTKEIFTSFLTLLVEANEKDINLNSKVVSLL